VLLKKKCITHGRPRTSSGLFKWADFDLGQYPPRHHAGETSLLGEANSKIVGICVNTQLMPICMYGVSLSNQPSSTRTTTLCRTLDHIQQLDARLQQIFTSVCFSSTTPTIQERVQLRLGHQLMSLLSRSALTKEACRFGDTWIERSRTTTMHCLQLYLGFTYFAVLVILPSLLHDASGSELRAYLE
jgi:hypothetical protein